MERKYTTVSCCCCNTPAQWDTQGNPVEGWYILKRNHSYTRNSIPEEWWCCGKKSCMSKLMSIVSNSRTEKSKIEIPRVQELTIWDCDGPRCKQSVQNDAKNPMIGGTPFAGWIHHVRIPRFPIDEELQSEFHFCSEKCSVARFENS